MFCVWFFALFLHISVKGLEVCYDRLGCFTNDPPWSGTLERPLLGLPEPPALVNTGFCVYTRENPVHSQVISAINPSTIQASNFRTNRRTCFIIHGYFLNNKDYFSIIEICKHILQKEDINCVAVKWESGKVYLQAVQNIRIVGAELAFLLDYFEKNYGYSPFNVHIIGHSLGAHAAGETGRRIRGVRRITGLDPAGPLFHNTPPEVRLDPSDAEFVDVIHTNIGFLFFEFAAGYIEPCGHLDFYPNGGKIMHGCKQFLAPKHWDINQVMRDMTLGCSHKRSVLYYSNSVLIPDGFLGYRCNSYDSFLSGKCFPCPKETCPMMGHYADRFPGKTSEVHQVYYLNTEAFQPFACWREYVSVKLSGTQKMWGNIYVALIGSNEHRRQYPVANGLFSPTSTYAKIIDVSIPGNITAVEFQWKKDPAWKRTGLMGAQEVTILYGTNGHKSVFCGSQVVQPEITKVWIAALFFFGTGQANEVCYERIGCFSDKPPWSGIPGRQLLPLPASPESMNITFSLFTKETGNMSQEISATNISTIRNSYFSPLRKTRFVIHGYTSTGKYGWVVELCLLLVKVENINCIAVDWEDGAKCTYFIASSNTRVLGAEIAYLINTFTKMYAYCPAHIHLIGHSLGAHTAGEAGRRLRGVNRIFPGLGRITGLDPAGLCFEGFPPMVRLDPSDAEFVDVIHTNAGSFPTIGYGMVNATGDLDFYPNGGTTMSGCDKTTPLIEMDPEGFVKELRSVGNCHHSRSYEYYRYSILFPEGFLGYPCESYKSFEEGQCFPCPREGCPFMGHYADKFRYKRRKNNSKYYLNTAPEEPFTSWRYNISVKLSGMKNVRGEINIAFYSKDGTGKDYPIVSGRLNRGDIYSKLTDVEINPENAGRVEFLWHKKAFTLLWAELGAERVRLVYGKDGHESFLCGSGTVRDEVSQILTPC